MGCSSCDVASPHALVVPHRAHGHVVGTMLFSESLAELGFTVSFVYFTSYYTEMQQRNHVVLPMPRPMQEDKGDSLSQSNGCRCSSRDGHNGGSDMRGDGCGGGGSGDAHATKLFSHGKGRNRENSCHAMISSSSFVCGGHGGRGQICVYVVDDGLAPGQFLRYFSVAPAMKENLYKLILDLQDQGCPPTCLISDSFVPWTLEVAQRASIPRVEFWTANAMGHLLFFNLDPLYAQGIFPIKGSRSQWKSETPVMLSHIPGVLPFPSELIPEDLRFVDSSNYFAQFFHQVNSCVKFGDRILIHTMSELEPHAFKAFELQGLCAYAIGPLLHHRNQHDSKQTGCISWLNLQAESSVIYVAFGSAARMFVNDVWELAMGLEASGNPFLWVIREDAYRMEELPRVLPGGFLERTRGKGFIVSWAPQLEVLAHKAIGGFLSHCGWNSTLESFWFGVPMLCCPCHAEQRLNSHYICNVWGVGLELERTETGGIDRGFVELGVKALLQGEEGAKTRSKAQEIMHLAKKTCQPGGQSFANLQKFCDDMRELCTKPAAVTHAK